MTLTSDLVSASVTSTLVIAALQAILTGRPFSRWGSRERCSGRS
ncbi:MAG: hypothetical protein U0599_13025 [Vicinamibacteria bacterium]